MLHSMTGYGKSEGVFQNKKIIVELKSLNSKSLDLYTKLPLEYKEKELELRKLVAEKVIRGKIELQIQVELNGESKSASINHTLAKSYFDELVTLEKTIGRPSKDILSLVLRMPDIYTTEKQAIPDDEWRFVTQLLANTFSQFEKFRQQEGQSIRLDFEQNIQNIATLLNEISQYEQERVETIKARMYKALEEKSNDNIDENRLEQELIFYIEKLDISEEKTRLSNHLNYFLDTMNNEKVAGKKLGFIAQEIGREINTLGSKSNHAEMQKIVVMMKDNLEKIKEQILNTL